MKDSISLKGRVRVWQGDTLVCDSHNRVVTLGLELFARLVMAEEGALLPSKFLLGDSAALTTNAMTGLQGSKIAECACTASRRNNVLSWQGTFTFDENNEKDCREIGLFNAESPAIMMARFLPVQQFKLKSGTPVRINWEIIVGE